MSLPKPYYEDEAVTIYHGDAGRFALDMDYRIADAIITDPPYGIGRGAAFVRLGGEVIECRGEAIENKAVNFIGSWAWHVKHGGYFAFFHKQQERLSDFDWKAWTLKPHHKFYLVKQAPPVCPRKTFQSGVEECSVYVNTLGDRYWGGGGATPNYWRGMTPNRLAKGHGHEFEKPIEAMRILVECLSPPGGLILDPFMGSGTTLRAAKDLGRKAIGIEIEEKYCEIAAKRMAQEVLPL